ncbi:MAG: N-acetyltransferase family protein [Dehalogenimonas sp.]
MPDIVVRCATKEDVQTVLELVRALAEYEKLEPPDQAAQARFAADMVAERPRFEVYLAEYDGIVAGCAIVFETYGSFQGKPKLYIEDLFILDEYRRHGVGKVLFQSLIAEAHNRGYSTMEWTALDWNTSAHRFYHKMGGRRLETWQVFRLEL